jgi:signal transduction histidine kinase
MIADRSFTTQHLPAVSFPKTASFVGRPIEDPPESRNVRGHTIRIASRWMDLWQLNPASANKKLRLEREIARRKASELAIRKSEEKYHNLFLESQLMKDKLHQLMRQIISAQEEERKEISRELHDNIVQGLVAINIELSALGNGTAVGRHALKTKVARISRLVEHSVKAVHRFARELRPAVLDDLGLLPALNAYCKGVAARKKIKIRMTALGSVEALGSAKQTALFRVAQEALTNVVRHSGATKVSLNISEFPDAIQMEIWDNGKSFNVENVVAVKNPKRLGLLGMRERIEMVGGILKIESAPGKGTTVRAKIPLEQEKSTK